MKRRGTKNNLLAFFTVLLTIFFIASPFVFVPDFFNNTLTQKNSAQAFDFSSGLIKTAKKVGLTSEDKLLGEPNLPIIIGKFIYSALGLIGVIFLILIIVAGLQWMTASGSEERVTNSKRSIKNATIGILVILSAYMITYFIINIVLN